jgi:hypothetical protein
MRCPKCDEGNIIKVKLKNNQQLAYMCDFCENLWFEGEAIGIGSGHALGSYSHGENLEYTVEKASEKDQEHEVLDQNKHK